MEINPNHIHKQVPESTFSDLGKDDETFKHLLNRSHYQEKIEPPTKQQEILKNLLQHLQLSKNSPIPNSMTNHITHLMTALEHCIFNLASCYHMCLLYSKERKQLPLHQRFSWLYDEVLLLEKITHTRDISHQESTKILKEIAKLAQHFNISLLG